MNKLSRDFYMGDTVTTARELLGKYLVRQMSGNMIAGRIIETEAYIGAIDKACHAYNGKVTPRTKTLYGPPGHAYIYFIYGMYHCMNVVTEPEGQASAVLIRGLDIVKGFDTAAGLRYGTVKLSPYQIRNISNGPGKLCMALDLTRELNGCDLLGDELYITDGLQGVNNVTWPVKATKRVGIDYAEEAKDFLWRFI